MKNIKNRILLLCILIMVGGVLSACNKEGNDKTLLYEENNKSDMRVYKDYRGHETEIPTSPKRVIFHGESFGDLLAIGVDAVGGGSTWIDGSVFEERAKDVEDVGFPINLEKTLELKPDLIIIADTDEKVYEQLSKIAPTVVFDTFLPIEDRIPELGDLLGKKQAAKEWLGEYDKKVEMMWTDLIESGTIKEGETASVLTYYPGNRLFIMAGTGLSQVIYAPHGFKPLSKTQDILDAQKGFEEISIEVLSQYAGDRIFILTPKVEESIQAVNNMVNSDIWKELPAVKSGHVYTIDILKSSSDATTREWLLEELPRLMKSK